MDSVLGQGAARTAAIVAERDAAAAACGETLTLAVAGATGATGSERLACFVRLLGAC
jgi:hypothetical protein